MAAPVEVQKLKGIIKAVMKKQGLQYKDLGKALNVSIPTVNRILNEDDISLERFHEILDWLGLTLLDVAEISRDLRGKVTEHTPEQEEYLATHPQHLLIFDYFRDGGYSIEEIREKYGLNQKSVDKYLRDLENQGLIEMYPNGRVKPLINHIRWRRGGALRRTFGPKMAKFFYDVTLKTMMKRHEQEDPGTHHRGSIGILMREETFEKMKQDLDELEKKYRTLSKIEVPLERKENLRWVIYSFLIAIRDLKDDLYEIPKNIYADDPANQNEAHV